MSIGPLCICSFTHQVKAGHRAGCSGTSEERLRGPSPVAPKTQAMGDEEAGQARIHVSCSQGSLLPNKLPPPSGTMALGPQEETARQLLFSRQSILLSETPWPSSSTESTNCHILPNSTTLNGSTRRYSEISRYCRFLQRQRRCEEEIVFTCPQC